MVITEQEALLRLKEDKYIESPKERMEYIVPTVELIFNESGLVPLKFNGRDVILNTLDITDFDINDEKWKRLFTMYNIVFNYMKNVAKLKYKS